MKNDISNGVNRKQIKSLTGFTRQNFLKKNLGGFTIIELLVVIAIAAMIVSVFFVLITGTRAKSRDAVREQDIKQIQNGLAIYASGKGIYPICSPEIIINGKTDCLSAELLGDGAMKGITPVDPKNSGSTCGGSGAYVYCYISAGGSDYTLRYNLETDSITGKSSGWQSIGP